MICRHLAALEAELLQSAIMEISRGAPWSRNCREWVYYACVFDRAAIRQRFDFAQCVVDHEHLGTHDGSEAGFACQICHDAIMGAYPLRARNKTIYR